MGRDQEHILSADPFELAMSDGIDDQYWVDHLTRSQRAIVGARAPGIDQSLWGAQRDLPATAETGFVELLRVGPFVEPDDFIFELDARQQGDLTWSERPILEVRAQIGVGNAGWNESWSPSPGSPSALIYPPRRVVTCQSLALACRQVTPGTHDFGVGALATPGILRASLTRRRAGTLPALIAYQLVAAAAAAGSTRIQPPPRGATHVHVVGSLSGGSGSFRVGATTPGGGTNIFAQQVAALNNVAVSPYMPIDGYGDQWWVTRSIFAGAETIMIQWLR